MKITLSWDDGALQDQKLFELHEKYRIPGMFFVPTNNREDRDTLAPQMIKNAESRYIQFGGHTYNHVYLTEISIQEAEKEAVNNKKYLEDILGHEVEHFCLPGGKYNDEIVDMLFRHFKTVRTADTMNFKNKDALLRPSFHFYPRGVKSLVGNGLRQKSLKELGVVLSNINMDYFDLLREIIRQEQKRETLIMIWGHSWEIEELGLWNKLEELFQCVTEEFPHNVVPYYELAESMS